MRNPYRLAVVNSHPIQYFAPLYRRLAAEPDIDLTVYFCSRAGAEEYEDEGFGGESFSWDVPLLDGYDHRFLPNTSGVSKPDGFWSLTNPSIIPTLYRERYDAVWLHGHGYASYLFGLLGGLAAGSAFFMRCETHLGLDRPPLRRMLRQPVMTGFYRLFDACLAIGTRNAEFYRQHGVSQEELFLVPYAVENRRFREGSRSARKSPSQARRTLGLPDPEVPVVLFLSKLIPRKRPMDLLRAFATVRQEDEGPLALAVVGEGPERKRLEEFVDQRQVPDVHFLGFRNQSELPEIYGASDIFVLPSENEPWGLVVNEAMSAGLPIVVTDEVGAAADLVREELNGFKYPVGNVEVLSEKLTRLARDPALRQRMGRSSLEIIAEWDLDACVEGVREALQAMCENRSPDCSVTKATQGASNRRGPRFGG